MKKLIKINLSVVILLLLVLLVACTSKDVENGLQTTEASSSTIEITIMIDNGENNTKKNLVVNQENNLLEIMVDKFEAKEKNGFITEIEGSTQNKDENKYWVYTINDTQVTKGAREITLENGDKVAWKLDKF